MTQAIKPFIAVFYAQSSMHLDTLLRSFALLTRDLARTWRLFKFFSSSSRASLMRSILALTLSSRSLMQRCVQRRLVKFVFLIFRWREQCLVQWSFRIAPGNAYARFLYNPGAEIHFDLYQKSEKRSYAIHSTWLTRQYFDCLYAISPIARWSVGKSFASDVRLSYKPKSGQFFFSMMVIWGAIWEKSFDA